MLRKSRLQGWSRAGNLDFTLGGGLGGLLNPHPNPHPVRRFGRSWRGGSVDNADALPQVREAVRGIG